MDRTRGLATLIIFFSFFLGMDNAWLHRWAVVALTVAFAFIMFTIVALDRPFGPGFRVGPDAFERALNTMKETSEPGS